jgi:hypothetical protein
LRFQVLDSSHGTNLYDYTWAWRTEVAPEAVSALVQSTRQLAREMASGDVVRMLFEDTAYASASGGGGGGSAGGGSLQAGSAASLGDHAGGGAATSEPLLVAGHRSGMEALLQPYGSVVGVLFHQLEAGTPAADELAAEILAQATRRFSERYAAQLERLTSPTGGSARARAEAEDARRAFHEQSRDFDVVLHDVIAAAAGSGNVLPLALPSVAGGLTDAGASSVAGGSEQGRSAGGAGGAGSSGSTLGSTAGGGGGVDATAAADGRSQPVRGGSGLSLRSVGAVQVASPVGTVTPTERPVLLTPQPQAKAQAAGGGDAAGRRDAAGAGGQGR